MEFAGYKHDNLQLAGYMIMTTCSVICLTVNCSSSHSPAQPRIPFTWLPSG